MNPNYAFNLRLTGILIENDRLLLVQQRVSESRSWSLPGGRLERGETIAQGLRRELQEETGLDTEILRLLYVCDVAASDHTLLHMTFLLRRIGGELCLPTNEHDANPIHDVRFVPINDLPQYGFSAQFIERIRAGFPAAGSYPGDKTRIGL